MTRMTFEYDSEPYGKERDAAIIKMARNFGVETRVKNSHTLYNLDRSDIHASYVCRCLSFYKPFPLFC